MNSIRAEFKRPDALPGVNHSDQKSTNTAVQICVHNYYTNININLHSKPPFSHLLRHTWVKAVMQFYAHTTKHMQHTYVIMRINVLKSISNRNNVLKALAAITGESKMTLLI